MASYLLTTTVVAKRTAAQLLVAKRALLLPAFAATIDNTRHTNSAKSVRSSSFSTSKEGVPDEDYYDGHLLVDHLEYLDDMLDKTLAIEDGMMDLKEIYAQKRQAYRESASLEQMEELFLQAETQKEGISAQVTSLKAILLNAKTNNSFAVDGPDGTSDATELAGVQEVNHIISHAANHEDVQTNNSFAVDGPDGTSDATELAGVQEVNHIISHAANHEDVQTNNSFAVDGPDGTSDATELAGVQEVNHIISHAANMKMRPKSKRVTT